MLAGHRIDTNFIVEQIARLNLRLRVIWLGDKLWYALHELMRLPTGAGALNANAFLVLHRTPSDIIDGDIDFQPVAMFDCAEHADATATDTLCSYEATPIMKYCSTYFTSKFDNKLHHVSKMISMGAGTEKGLLRAYGASVRDWFGRNGDGPAPVYVMPAPDRAKLIDQIACNYIRQNGSLYHRWIDGVREHLIHEILLGTFYPNWDENKEENIGNYAIT